MGRLPLRQLCDDTSRFATRWPRSTESPLPFERFGPLGELRVAERTVTEVAANWKILVENYNECLTARRCIQSSSQVVPAYKRGEVLEEGRRDAGVSLADNGTASRPAATRSYR